MSEWDSVTKIGKRAGPGARTVVAKSQSQINAARRAGAVVATEKKYAVGNKSQDPAGQHLTKIDRENEVKPPSTTGRSVAQAIQKGRQAKGWAQKDLAQRINEKPQVVNEYENGRAIPNQQILTKMERALGVKLRGQNIGAPLGGPKKK
ncbi:transcriptional coactivator [Schizosaccharomyces japonicus yFS275]|uniref:Transcriptional coactivator n=1 Tax=Schizosaccharomyces japonicus (strain yFS275 / FY16936) TaxID=402676 RepID=B6JV65_SCHJY|nr:transcriptional coactivator [Schizosaccharomyces japonicus yFS275]EEB05266.1 transcriptional coactivator [Schizosaccharomyces japonicus yFS275]